MVDDSEKTVTGKTALKERGWTDTLIKKLAPTPIRTRKNTQGRGFVLTWLLDDIAAIENEHKKEFDDAHKRQALRSEIAERRIAEEIKDAVTSLHIREPKRIVFRVHGNYDYGEPYFVSVDPSTLDDETRTRLARNYLRHECSNYDEIVNRRGFGAKRYEALWDALDAILNASLAKYDLTTGRRFDHV